MHPERVKRAKKTSYELAGDFVSVLESFKMASGISWAEIARRLGTSVVNLWRWRKGIVPNTHHLLALQELADGMGLGHLLRGVRLRQRP